MTCDEILREAVEFCQELIDSPGDNPDFFDAWRKTQAEWQAALDSPWPFRTKRVEQGAESAMEKIRKVGVEAGDWEEYTGAVYGSVGPYGKLSDKCFRRLDKWRDAAL